MKILKKLNTLVYSILLSSACLWSVQLQADDTDIYVTPGASADEPMVMFVLDWRSNLGSTICNSFAGGDTDATIASNCGWTTSFVANLTADDKSDGVIDRFELIRGVLKTAMASLDGVKIGLMLNHNDSCNGGTTSGPSLTGCSNGSYVVQGFKSIDSSDSNGNKAAFHTLLASIPDVTGSGHKYQGKELYFELFRYLTGQGVYNGHLAWEDFGNSTSTDNLDGTGGPESPDYSAIAWDTNIENGTDYITPFKTGTTCTKVFALNFIFGVLNSQSDSDSAISETYGNGGMDSLVLSGGGNTQFGSVVQWMYNTDLVDGNINMQYYDIPTTTYTNTNLTLDGSQNLTSYFIVQSPSTTENNWAQNGGTNSAIAWSDDPDTMVTKITDIFNQILSVSTTFVSASVPVNVFNRAEFLDDVYIAVFEAEENGYPKWIGNLKKLKLQQDLSLNWFIGDVNGTAAFASDGRIKFNALTYWTDATADDVVAADTSEGEITGFDGRSVDRGGAGQKIPGKLSVSGTITNGQPGNSNSDANARQIFTEPSSYTNGTAATLMALDATTTNASALWTDLNAAGVASSGTTLNNTTWSAAATYAAATATEQTEALNLLKFARGIDVMDEDIDTDTTDPRPWIMSDPIHSRPLTINYGDSDAGAGSYSATNPDVRIIVTSNAGSIHMFENTTSAGTESGAENWAFYPRYALRIQDRLMNNTAGSPVHPYGVDGAPSLYTYDANGDGNLVATDGDLVYLYFGMRRGGRYYYALDISDPDTPKMLWSISNSSTGFSELGLTFSRPQLKYLSYINGASTYTNQPVLIFGGGYDANKDTRSNSLGSDDSMGNAVFIVNATDGSLIWKAVHGTTGSVSSTEYAHGELHDSIPADISTLDSDGNGSTDRLYFGDTGGNVWRVDLVGTTRTNWKIQKFAKLGRASASASKDDDRRIFHAVDIVQTRDSSGAFDAVIVGSGDRANPLDTSILSTKIADNWLYMLKDRNTVSNGATIASADIIDHADPADLSDNCYQEVGLTCTSTQQTALASYGWKIALSQGTGEKGLSRPLTLNGAIYFTTYLPPTGVSVSCGPEEGSGLTYVVNLQDATAVYDFDLTNSATDASGEVQTLQVEDRYRTAGAGIPADVIAIRKDGQLHAITPGDNYTTSISGNAGWKTFWYTEGE